MLNIDFKNVYLRLTDFNFIKRSYDDSDYQVDNRTLSLFKDFKYFDNIVPYLNKTDTVKVFMVGGEPTTRPELMSKTIKLVRRINKEYTEVRLLPGCVTDGLNLITVIDRVDTGRLTASSVVIKWDGAEQCKDGIVIPINNGCIYSDLYINKMMYILAENIFSKNITIEYTICDRNLQKWEDDIAFLSKLFKYGFRLRLKITEFYTYMEEDIRDFIKESKEFEFDNLSKAIKLADLDNDNYEEECYKRNNYLFIDTDGSLYLDMNKNYFIGTLKHGIDEKAYQTAINDEEFYTKKYPLYFNDILFDPYRIESRDFLLSLQK